MFRSFLRRVGYYGAANDDDIKAVNIMLIKSEEKEEYFRKVEVWETMTEGSLPTDYDVTIALAAAGDNKTVEDFQNSQLTPAVQRELGLS